MKIRYVVLLESRFALGLLVSSEMSFCNIRTWIFASIVENKSATGSHK